MKQIILKTGVLLFFYTLIISNHIEKSKYMILNDIEETAENSRKALKEEKEFIIPYKQYITKEEYVTFLSSYPSHLRNLVIYNSTERILPFHNIKNLLFTIFLLLSVGLIIISIDLNPNKNIAILIVVTTFYLFQNFSYKEKITPIPVNPQIEKDILVLETSISDLESNLSYLDNRVSDLEY